MYSKIKCICKNETIRYIFIGICTTAVNYIMFALLYNLFGINLNLSNFFSITCSIIFAFFANKSIVFKSNGYNLSKTIKEFVGFISGRAFTMVIEIAGIWLMVENFKLNEYLAKTFFQIIILILNYIISKFFVFKK